MPLLFRILISIFPAIILAYVYTAWKLYHAAINILPLDPIFFRFYLIGCCFYMNLFPISLIIYRRMQKKQGVDNMPMPKGNRFVDIVLAHPFWFGLLLVAEVLPWLILTDFLKIPLYPFYRRFQDKWLHVQFSIILAVFSFYIAYVFIRLVVDSTRIKITRLVYPYRQLPAGLHGSRLVHISDIQADRRTGSRRIKRYIRKVNKLNPDIVFFSGDLITSSKKRINQAAAIIAQIKSKSGIYACIGDHDFGTDVQDVISCLTSHGIKVVQDRNEFINIRGGNLLLTTVTNIYQKRPTLDSLNFLMGQQPRGVLDIFLTHQPSETIIELAAERGYQIFLAGHTHGGQILFKPFGLTFALAKFETPFYRGFCKVQKMLVNINNGLGFTFVPARYRAPAEVTLIELRKV